MASELHGTDEIQPYKAGEERKGWFSWGPDILQAFYITILYCVCMCVFEGMIQNTYCDLFWLTLNYQVQSFSSWDITDPLVWFWLSVSFRWFLGFYMIADSSAKNPGWSLLMALTHGQGSQWSPVCREILNSWSSDPDPILWTTGYPLSTSKLNKLKQETYTVFPNMRNASNPTSRPLLTPESHFGYLPFRSSPFVASCWIS